MVAASPAKGRPGPGRWLFLAPLLEDILLPGRNATENGHFTMRKM